MEMIIKEIEVKSILSKSDLMEAFHKAGVRTTCFISPIFLGITNVRRTGLPQ